MKKRITALLLCLVMVLSLIPTTVWAASTSWNFDVRLRSGKFFDVNGNRSNSYNYRVNNHPDSTKAHTVEAYFKWDSSAGGRYSKYSGGWRLYVKIDGTEHAQNAYVYSYDMSTASASYTTPYPTNLDDTTAILDITVGPAQAPSKDYVEYENWVNLVCTTKNDATPSKCSLINGTYTIGEVTGNYAKRCTITIKDDDESIGKYVAKVDGHQAGTGHDRTITLKLDEGEWVLNENDTATINVTCDNGGQTEPTLPTSKNDFVMVPDNLVAVKCDTITDGTHDASYGLLDNTAARTYWEAKKMTVNGKEENRLVIYKDAYFNHYKESHDTHSANYQVPQQTFEIEQTEVGGVKKWAIKYSPSTSGEAYVTINVKCDSTSGPTTPTDEDLAALAGVRVVCNTSSDNQTPVKHSNMDMPFIKGTYTVNSVYKNGDKYYCVVEINNPNAYVNQYSSNLSTLLLLTKGETVTFDHKYVASTASDKINASLVYENGKWVLDGITTTVIQGENGPQTVIDTRNARVATINCACNQTIKAPTTDEMNIGLANGAVQVYCNNSVTGHGPEQYALRDGTWEPLPEYKNGPVKNSDGKWSYSIGLITSNQTGTAPYVNDFIRKVQTATGVEHVYSSIGSRNSLYFIYNESTDQWKSDYYPISIFTTCAEDPYDSTLQNLLGDVKINCTNTSSEHSTVTSKEYPFYSRNSSGFTLTKGTHYTLTTVLSGSKVISTLTLNVDKIREQFDSDVSNITHRLVNSSDATVTLYLARPLNSTDWYVSDAQGTKITTFQAGSLVYNVTCGPLEPKPDAPDKDVLLDKGVVKVECIGNLKDSHGSKTYNLLDDEDIYTTKDANDQEAQVVPSADGTKWTYTFWLMDYGMHYYSQQFDSDIGFAHLSHTLYRNTITLEYVNGAWQLAADGAALIHVDNCGDAKPTVAPNLALGKVMVSCDKNNSHIEQEYSLIEGTYTTDVWYDGQNHGPSTVYSDNGQWYFEFYIHTLQYEGKNGIDGTKPYIEKFNSMYGTHLLTDCGDDTIRLRYDSTDGKWVYDNKPAKIYTACAPTAAELGLDVNVSCVGSGKHTDKTYGGTSTTSLLTNTNLVYTLTWNDTEYRYEYLVRLAPDAANGYVADYSKLSAVNKEHKLSSNGAVTIYWDQGPLITSAEGNTPVVFANKPSGWYPVDDNDHTLKVTATCDNGGTTPGGNNIGPAKNPYIKEEPKKVQSGKTFDAGIALYVGLGILSMTGSAVVIRKKKEF